MSENEINENGIIDLLVIGAGASGMTAAIVFQKTLLSERKPLGNVVILEKNDRVGKKVMVTGNGRCNLSNKDMSLSHFHCHVEEFPEKAISLVPQQQVLAFLGEIGIVTTYEENKLFPMSKTAASVVDAFRFALDDFDIKVVPNAEVVEVSKDPESDLFRVTCADESTYSAKKLLIASGGACAPYTGTTGDGYKFLSMLGHKVYAPKPSIVQLVTENYVTKALSGLKLDCDLTLLCEGFVVANQYGEVLFTDYGLSGPAVLQVSGEVSRRTRKGRLSMPMKVSLKLFNDPTIMNIREDLFARREEFSDRPLDQLLLSILPQKIGSMLIRTALDRPMSMPVSALTDGDIEKIISTMRSWEFDVIGTKGLESAQTTIGGADCEEFSPKSMQSRIVPGLYATGEVLDVDGDCGGYNLTWAFTSGILAGSHSAKKSDIYQQKAGEPDGN